MSIHVVSNGSAVGSAETYKVFCRSTSYGGLLRRSNLINGPMSFSNILLLFRNIVLPGSLLGAGSTQAPGCCTPAVLSTLLLLCSHSRGLCQSAAPSHATPFSIFPAFHLLVLHCSGIHTANLLSRQLSMETLAAVSCWSGFYLSQCVRAQCTPREQE